MRCWRVCAALAPIGRVWLISSVATLAGTAAKDELKWIFGRPWPSTWQHDGIYSFHPFSVSMLFGGFPSGHTAYISAPLCVLWVLAPRYRIFCGGIIALVMFGLVAAGYHFVGDVLGGLLTGMACAWGSLVLMLPAMLSGLLGSKRFLPLFLTQALGAINDNIFKNAVVVLALFRLAHAGPILVALAGGIFLLPYALFSAIAGDLADAFEKSRRSAGSNSGNSG